MGEGWSLAEVCRAFDICRNTAVRVRARFAEGGVDAVLSERLYALLIVLVLVADAALL
jgi:hypothetical protein